jgi:hypothetical protein
MAMWKKYLMILFGCIILLLCILAYKSTIHYSFFGYIEIYNNSKIIYKKGGNFKIKKYDDYYSIIEINENKKKLKHKIKGTSYVFEEVDTIVLNDYSKRMQEIYNAINGKE